MKKFGESPLWAAGGMAIIALTSLCAAYLVTEDSNEWAAWWSAIGTWASGVATVAALVYAASAWRIQQRDAEERASKRRLQRAAEAKELAAYLNRSFLGVLKRGAGDEVVLELTNNGDHPIEVTSFLSQHNLGVREVPKNGAVEVRFDRSDWNIGPAPNPTNARPPAGISPGNSTPEDRPLQKARLRLRFSCKVCGRVLEGRWNGSWEAVDG